MYVHARHRRPSLVLTAALATALAGSVVAAPAATAADPVTFVVTSSADEPDADLGDGDCETATAGECTLRAAVQQANADTAADVEITIQVPAGLGPYLLTDGELLLTDEHKSGDASYVIAGTGGSAVIEGPNGLEAPPARVLHVSDTGAGGHRLDVALQDLELTRGRLDADSEPREVQQLAVENEDDGAGLLVEGDTDPAAPTSVVLDRVVVRDNYLAGGYGAGIANFGADMLLRDSRVADNFADDGDASGEGGGIYTGSVVTPTSSLTLQDTDLVDNRAAEGGGIWASTDDVVTISGGSFTGNLAVQLLTNGLYGEHVGGAIYADRAQVDITGAHFEGNAAAFGGGAIYTGSGPYYDYDAVEAGTGFGDAREAIAPQVVEVGTQLTIADSTFVGNGETSNGDEAVATITGGAIQATYGDVLTITDSSFASNVAQFVGGAVETGGATTHITGSTFTTNHAVCPEERSQPTVAVEVPTCENGGGAISTFGPGMARTLYVSSSSFVGNTGSFGGAVLNDDVAYFTNVTFVDNHAWIAGALYNMGELNLARTTVARNTASAPDSAGGLVEDSGNEATSYLAHTLFAENTAGGDVVNCVEDSGLIVSEGHNVADDTSCFADGEAAGDQVVGDAGLGTLDSSGSTAVVPLLASSPAIDVDSEGAACPTATEDGMDADAHADEAARDQRGAAAPVDGDGDGTVGCDAGAFEFQTNVVRVTGTTDGAEAGPVDGAVTFAREGDTHAPLTVTITFGGSATAGVDYVAPPTAVTFPAGQTTTTRTIPVADDEAVEPTETVVVTVVDGAGYLVGAPAAGTVEIVDNDGASRLDGGDRIDTAVLTSQFSYPDGADTVVIARSDLYADALAGGPLAHDIEAPILVTPTTTLDPRVQAEIARLGATEAIILGGTTAIADSVEAALRDHAGLATERLDGATRFETAVLVAEALGADTVYVTEGDNPDPNRGWPDAVSVSSLAAHQGRAILFATTETLPEVTRTHLQGVDGATVVGGPNAVSVAVEQAIEAVTTVSDRIEGETRYATAVAVADAAVAAGLTPDTLWVARGDNWVDALVAGPAVARAGDVFLLVPSDDLAQAPEVQGWIAGHGDVIEHVRIMGGETAVSAVVEQQLLRALNP